MKSASGRALRLTFAEALLGKSDADSALKALRRPLKGLSF
ncbi:MAG: hypothetical protein CISAcid_17550 [uncultured Acidilobus sp. CIS]|nr:MAG: hypothetical protein CISAcid_17550 [uncultured Acidilobus sp. CIS]